MRVPGNSEEKQISETGNGWVNSNFPHVMLCSGIHVFPEILGTPAFFECPVLLEYENLECAFRSMRLGGFGPFNVWGFGSNNCKVSWNSGKTGHSRFSRLSSRFSPYGPMVTFAAILKPHSESYSDQIWNHIKTYIRIHIEIHICTHSKIHILSQGEFHIRSHNKTKFIVAFGPTSIVISDVILEDKFCRHIEAHIQFHIKTLLKNK